MLRQTRRCEGACAVPSTRILATPLLALALATCWNSSAHALILGGEGNKAVADPGWPAGAAEIFNQSSRVAWWEGPPFGGGHWHADYRGDAKTLNAILAAFAKLDGKSKQVVVHGGAGQSFWLNPNHEAAKRANAAIDWTFSVWAAENWKRLNQDHPDGRPLGSQKSSDDPPLQLDIYIGGNVPFSEIELPPDLKVVDVQGEKHGFSVADGVVLQGTVIDLKNQKPLVAKAKLQLIKPNPKGGYEYTTVRDAETDGEGRWLMKNAPTGWHRVVISATDYVPRVVGTAQFEEPSWVDFPSGLSEAAQVSGQVTDNDGTGLPGVEVMLTDVIGSDGTAYESRDGYRAKTDSRGRFRMHSVPFGTAKAHSFFERYFSLDMGETIKMPSDEIKLIMHRAGELHVTVKFNTKERPRDYIIEVRPPGDLQLGSWVGGKSIDKNNQAKFTGIPPGEYVVRGHPNPSILGQTTEGTTVKIGSAKESLTITAK